MSKREEERQRLLSHAEERGEFDYLEDGFVYYFPAGGGAISAHHLRWIADELDSRNEDWQRQIDEYFTERQRISQEAISAADGEDSDEALFC